MKILRITSLLNVGEYQNNNEFKQIEDNICCAIESIRNPSNANGFYLFEGRKANGVKPIKEAFIDKLDNLGWKNERIADSRLKNRRFDSSRLLSNNKFFGVE